MSSASEPLSAATWHRACISLPALVIILLVYQRPISAQESGGEDATMAAYNRVAASGRAMNALLKSGINKHKSGEDAAAKKIFAQVLAIDPGNSNAWFNLGVIAEQEGDLKAALKDYQSALRQAPGDKEFEAAVAQVQAANKARASKVLTEDQTGRRETVISTDVMPPYAPSFAVRLPTARTRYQNNLDSQQAYSFRQAPRSPNSETRLGLKNELLRTTLGVARLLNVDTCSLCGVLRRW